MSLEQEIITYNTCCGDGGSFFSGSFALFSCTSRMSNKFDKQSPHLTVASENKLYNVFVSVFEIGRWRVENSPRWWRVGGAGWRVESRGWRVEGGE